ncbi:hypothetical protein H4R35_004284 [Dimargaris xerosporica]|nr:hypothetical protein H4R35_004284 [Dimargaris xerosporica]
MATGIGDDRDSAPAARASGIVAVSDHQGDTRHVVPASRRPDGTLRKERAVRPGYTPPEDIQRYQPPAHREGNLSAPGSPAATHTLRNLVASNERHNASPHKRGSTRIHCTRSPSSPSSAQGPPSAETPLPSSSPSRQRPNHAPRARNSPGGGGASLPASALRAALQSNHQTATGASHRQQATPVSYTSTDVFTSPNRKPGNASSPFSRRLVDSRPSTNRAGAQSTWRSNGPNLPQYSLRSPRPPHHRSSPPINQNAQSVPSPHGIKQSQKTIPTQPQQASPVPRRSKHTLQRRASPPLLPQDDDNDTDKLSQLVGNMHL